jgi:integrase
MGSYNTGARVSEIIALRRDQVRLEAADAHVELLGKGRKERVVPLSVDTARVLRAWFRELGNDGNGVAFPGVRGPGLSRDGVDHLLRRAVATAVAACPSLGGEEGIAARTA